MALSRLFVFGSMRSQEVLEAVLGRSVMPGNIRSASLMGYSLGVMPGERYPVLVRAPNSHVCGEVVDNLNEHDLARIVFFEGDEYDLNDCTVQLEGGGSESALFCDDHTLDPRIGGTWCFDTWMRTEQPSFLHMTQQFMAFFGRGSLEDAEALWQALETNTDTGSSAA